LQIDGLDVAKQAGSPGSVFGTDIGTVVVHEVLGQPSTMEFVVDDPLRALSLTQGQNVYAVDHRGVLLSTGAWRSDDLFLGFIKTVRRDTESLYQRWIVSAVSLDSLLDERVLTDGVVPANADLRSSMQRVMGYFDPRVSTLARDDGAQGAAPGADNLINDSGARLTVAVGLRGKTYREALNALLASSDLYSSLGPGALISDPEDVVIDIDFQGRYRFISSPNYVPFGGPSPTIQTIKQGHSGAEHTVVPERIEVAGDGGRHVNAVYVRGVDDASSAWSLNAASIAAIGRVEAFIEAPQATTLAAAQGIGLQYITDHQVTSGFGMLLSGTHDQLHPQGTTTPEWGGWHARTHAYFQTADAYWVDNVYPVMEVTKRFSGGGAHMEIELWAQQAAPSGAGSLSSEFASAIDTTRAAGRMIGTLDEVAIRSKAGIPTDADFDVPRDGFMVLDTTNNVLWIRTNGLWVPSQGYQYDYAEFTANVSITATTEATADLVVAGNSVTYDGTTAVLIEFYAPFVNPDTTAAGREIDLYLYDGTSIGRIGLEFAQVAAVNRHQPVKTARKLTPSAGAHAYSIRAKVSVGTGTVGAGVGGVGADMPGFIRITRA
jgi:hypothetical protein